MTKVFTTAYLLFTQNEEALTVGRQHNVAGETHLPTKFQDEVRMLRNLFSTMVTDREENEHMPFNEKLR